jgi:hypothetical protein
MERSTNSSLPNLLELIFTFSSTLISVDREARLTQLRFPTLKGVGAW